MNKNQWLFVRKVLVWAQFCGSTHIAPYRCGPQRYGAFEQVRQKMGLLSALPLDVRLNLL